MTQRLARLAYWAPVGAPPRHHRVRGRARLTGGFPFYSKVDPRTGTSALAIETDAGTGCQYILTPLGGILPRTGPDGKQLCEKRP